MSELASKVELAAVEIADTFAIDYRELFGMGRSRRVYEGRCTLAKLMRHRFRMSYNDIGDALDRDHSTMVHAVQRFDEIVRRDGKFAAIVAAKWPELIPR